MEPLKPFGWDADAHCACARNNCLMRLRVTRSLQFVGKLIARQWRPRCDRVFYYFFKMPVSMSSQKYSC